MTALDLTETSTVPFSMARSWRLVAAQNLPHVDVADVAQTDILLADLEDGTPSEDKAAARATIGDWLGNGRSVWLRINGATSSYWEDDIELASQHPGVVGVMLAMAETGDEVAATCAAINKPVVALVETALAFENLSSIASAGAARLAFGTGDFRRDIGITPDQTALLFPRSQLVITSRAHGLPGPIDGPTVANDADQSRSESAHAQSLGMTGRLCLTPLHVSVVNDVFSPSDAEIEAAQHLLNNPPSGYAGALAPRLAHAKQVLHRARSFGHVS